MTSRRRFVPACLALLGLGGALAARLAVELATDLPVPAGPSPVALEIPVPRAAAPGATEPAEARLAVLLARPPFDPRRRPPAAGESPAAAGLPRLTGVLVGASSRSAIFAAAAGERPQVVQEGDRIEAYLVQVIRPGEVVLLGPEGPRALRPAFDPAGSAPRGGDAVELRPQRDPVAMRLGAAAR